MSAKSRGTQFMVTPRLRDRTTLLAVRDPALRAASAKRIVGTPPAGPSASACGSCRGQAWTGRRDVGLRLRGGAEATPTTRPARGS
jgi:hypothetical protein